MNNFGFTGLNSSNPLMPYIEKYIQQQQQPQENTQQVNEPQRANIGVAPGEVNSQSELEYIVPDKSGRKQIVDCPSENKIYVGRYNHVRQLMDWRAYVDEGEIKLSQGSDSNAEMSQIATALLAVVDKLETMDTKIEELKQKESKVSEPVKEESSRRPYGQSKKSGEN